MSLAKFMRDAQKIYEAIPAPGAVVYDGTVAELLKGLERKIVNAIAEKIGTGTVLDLGSGTGFLVIEVAKRIPDSQVYGIDLSKGMIGISRKHAKNLENVQFELANATSLPFADDSIDFIVSILSFHHWKEPVKVFNECYRVLKNGKEVWIYDGCAEGAEQYSFPGRWILFKVLEAHGFTLAEYGSDIKSLLKQTKFKDAYRMEQTDIWMKIILSK